MIYPNVCGICEKICKDNLCKRCEINLKQLSNIQVEYHKNSYFHKHISIFPYRGIIKEKLIQYKFYDKIYIAKTISNFIIKNEKICRILKNYDIIIPVPIHYNRKLKRGYNQSTLIAKEIAKKLDYLQVIENVLYKKKNNQPQSKKNKVERKTNVIGAYQAKNIEKIFNKKIILLDDIYTTGNTVNECAKVLKEAGIKQIDVLTVAKD